MWPFSYAFKSDLGGARLIECRLNVLLLSGLLVFCDGTPHLVVSDFQGCILLYGNSTLG
jgi:hypothetical protein